MARLVDVARADDGPRNCGDGEPTSPRPDLSAAVLDLSAGDLAAVDANLDGASPDLSAPRPPSTIACYSQRALSGSDAPSTNQNYSLFSIGNDGTGLRPLTSLTALYAGAMGPQHSPDGTKIAFYSFQSNATLDGNNTGVAVNAPTNVWTVVVATQVKTPLTHLTKASCAGPFYSPDGTKIA